MLLIQTGREEKARSECEELRKESNDFSIQFQHFPHSQRAQNSPKILSGTGGFEMKIRKIFLQIEKLEMIDFHSSCHTRARALSVLHALRRESDYEMEIKIIFIL